MNVAPLSTSYRYVALGSWGGLGVRPLNHEYSRIVQCCPARGGDERPTHEDP